MKSNKNIRLNKQKKQFLIATKLFNELIHMDGGGSFNDIFGDKETLSSYITKNGKNQFLNGLETAYERSEESFREELADEAWNTNYIKSLGKSKEKLEKKLTKLENVIRKLK